MIDRIKRLGSDTAVYGISTILGRFLTFVLTPLYTHALPRLTSVSWRRCTRTSPS